MTTLSEYLSTLDERITSAKVKNIFPVAMRKNAINEAGNIAADFQNWPFLDHALTVSSTAGREYYQEPDRFKPDSIFRIMLDGDEYEMRKWNEFRELKELETDLKVASVLGGQYFIYPAPTADDLDIDVYGQLAWVKLVNDDDEAITPRALDEAILKIAMSILLKRERRPSEARIDRQEAEESMQRYYDRITQNRPAGYVGRARNARYDDF